MINLIAAALVAVTPTPSAPDANAQHHDTASHEAMKDCCDPTKDDCKDCCADMDSSHADHANRHDGHPAQ
jgi:hypothetical protein